ncbi:MAG TPA: BsuBI/PstI family type II restriction endonuclease [Ktedonobacterales bacterium]
MAHSVARDTARLTESGFDLLGHVDFLRLDAYRIIDEAHRSDFGQFFTPAPVAELMASMLECPGPAVHILDAGAGVGSLFAACVATLCSRPHPPQHVSVTAYELDAGLMDYLKDNLQFCRRACEQVGIEFTGEIIQADFIESAVHAITGDLFSQLAPQTFTCAILNPPYRKIQSHSTTRKLLRMLGMETSNLYTGFLAVAVHLLEPRGELVAITPRSFCNGPYFRPFRETFLKTMTLRRLHLFDSREEAFGDDGILQENIILSAVKGHNSSGVVSITSSTTATDDFIAQRNVEYAQVVHPGDPESFIHIVPDGLGQQFRERMAQFHHTLHDLNLSVSTGRVVDFRAPDFLRQQPEDGTAALIYPTHFQGGYIAWPKAETRKPNALAIAEQSQELLVPNEHYVLVKRFSAKEERRRVVAAVYDAGRIPGQFVGFENHLNYLHRNGRGLPLQLAKGLAAFLNSTVVDAYFRQFNGHTQVNATDLRSLKYPSLQQLETLGTRIGPDFPEQDKIDEYVEELFRMTDEQGSGPVRIKKRIDEALAVLKALGLPRAQQNQRSALTLLALLDLQPNTPWSAASNPKRGITEMMDYFKRYYAVDYAPNTRETVRRFTVHQFMDAGIVIANQDKTDRAVNSPKFGYQTEPGTLELLQLYGTPEWEQSLHTYLASQEVTRERLRKAREENRILVDTGEEEISLSPGGQNELIKDIIEQFRVRFTPGGKVLYVGDAGSKLLVFEEEAFAALGLTFDMHGKMPDVVIHYPVKNWLVLVEAVTSHGPINPLRHRQLKSLFANSSAGLVFVTAFLDRKAMLEYLRDISWETEVWIADEPDHLIHFNGERFLGPYQPEDEENNEIKPYKNT